MPRIEGCDCGHEHNFDILGISIGDNALEKLGGYIAAGGYKGAFLVCDLNTCLAAEAVERTLVLPCKRYTLPSTAPAADERAIGGILTAYDTGCDLIIGVGSGTINDLCRFVSYKIGVDYFIVATAASMDGYASSGSSITTRNVKFTHQAHAPKAIIGDTSIIGTAPGIMLAAGIGDILGKHVSLCDWELSHIVTGEYYCGRIADMVGTAVRDVTESAGDLEKIMHALVQSGIAMSYAGSSRPAGGSEHHISHFWEMRFMQQGRQPVLHGIKVGVATVAALEMYEQLRTTPDFDAAIANAKRFSFTDWEREMRRIFGESAETVVALERRVGKNAPENVINRINIYKTKWNDIRRRIDHLPGAGEVAELLRRAGAPVTPEEIGVDLEMFRESVIAAKETRDRFGLLQMIFDLGCY